jgi:hypothetical protein
MAEETLAEAMVCRAYEQYLRQPDDQEEATCQKM